MLAKIEWSEPKQQQPERVYSGFPWWHALLVKSNKEEAAAQWLMRVRVFVYLPTFMSHIHCRGKIHRSRLRAAMPGLLFVPDEMIEQWHRDDVLDHAPIYGFVRAPGGDPARMPKSEIEKVRLLEAKLNLPPAAKGVIFKVGQQVRFVEGSTFEDLGTARILEIASESRIRVQGPKLFGGVRPFWVPASEIEAM